MSISIQNILDSLPEGHKSRKVILPDITGDTVKNVVRRLKNDGFSPVICGTEQELWVYKKDIENGLEYFEVPEGEHKLIFAAKKVFEWKVYGFLGGNNEETWVTVSSIIKAKKSFDLPKERMTSHFLSEIWGRIILLADCALKNHESPDWFVAIVEQAVEAAKKYGIETPKIAMLSYATNPKVIPEGEKWYEKHISDMQTAILILKEKYGEDFPIEWPAQLDAVMNPLTAYKKNNNSIFGSKDNSEADIRPDILVYPSLEAGNIWYKTFNVLWVQTLWPVLSWTLHDLSRSATQEDIYNSVIINIL